MSSIYDSLNPAQQEAVRHTEGPLLVLAGAGSGKTRVLTHRIAYLIEECDVNPWNIFAITFTNKAAREMRERVDSLLSYGAEDVWVSTFHSACVRILRRYIDRLGYDRNFTIYDTDDQKTVVKAVIKNLGLDPKLFRERAVLSVISSAKEKMKTPGDLRMSASRDVYMKKVADIYEGYQERLKANNALDFDDLLTKTVELFENDAEALGYYQERFRYIMVDEYQDTNAVQFRFVSLLASKYRNLCVVGDDDQSIYKFRGADIRNILDFEEVFPDAAVIRLEENYRSTKNILNAANSVIRNNIDRKEKTLWTEKDEGSRIKFRLYPNEYSEAEAVVRDIAARKKSMGSYSDFAILYRTNAQSRVLEEKFVMSGIPYRVYGGVNFYQRKEIKDIIAYLRTVDSGLDDVSVNRIVNVPKRGIGSTSLGRAAAYAEESNISLLDALRDADQIPGLGRAAGKMKAFAGMIDELRDKEENMSLTGLYDAVLETTGYAAELKEENSDEAQTRLDNLDELRNKIAEYEEGTEHPSMTELLEEISLVADIDNMGEDDDRVALMTLHSAKGLEFPTVYMTGMEEGLFPSYTAITSDHADQEVEEERRLCYVGITRAMQTLTLTAARERRVHGKTQMNAVSRFVTEIPDNLLDMGYDEKRSTDYVRNLRGNAGRHSGAQNVSYYDFESEKSYNDGGRSRHGSHNAFSSGSDGEHSSERGSWRGGRYRQEGYYSTGPDSDSYGVYADGSGRGTRRNTSPRRGSSARKEAAGFIHKGSDIVKTKPAYKVGDRVRHVKFGPGTVLDVVEIPEDYQVSVNFDRAGIKKMRAGYAKLTRI